jgi:AcrR family transcriptional regulator
MSEIVHCDAKEGENLERKHRQIAQAASTLFIKKGFHKSSMREVAKAVGMPMSSLYHYIKSKDDVLYLVYGELYQIWAEGLAKLAEDAIERPDQKLRALLTVMLKAAYENKDLIQMTFRESKFLEKTALKKILATESKYIQAMIDIVKEGIEKGVFKEVDPIVIGSFIAYNSFFYPLRGWFFKDKVTYEAIESQIINFILNGLLKSPDPLG